MKSITLTVEAKYSDSDNCVCCEGNHRFMTNLRTSDGTLYDGGELARDVARQLPLVHHLQLVCLDVEALPSHQEIYGKGAHEMIERLETLYDTQKSAEKAIGDHFDIMNGFKGE
ncbi:hypothetical protein ACPF4J_003141 [Vibrio cholerae]